MPLFTPIHRVEDLPQAGTITRLAETQTIDFKHAYNPDNLAEMAKDIAAFANALGGALVIGSSSDEDPLAYPGLPPDRAAVLADRFRDAHARHISPKPPILDVQTIPSPDNVARVVLVVNVRPFADGVVGARAAQDTWRFPMRVGVDTNFLEPSMLPLYTSAVRRNVILLETIDRAKDRVRLSLRNPRNQFASAPYQVEATILRVDPERNVLVVTLEKDCTTQHRIPLDDVDAVWEAGETASREWIVRILGHFEVEGGTRRSYHSNPRNTVIKT